MEMFCITNYKAKLSSLQQNYEMPTISKVLNLDDVYLGTII